ncbi:rhomboid family intramembrane serine protease [Solihabitans fulvus]|uniref:Rhomboid family intramembrane serine protease n=1 Tax=Solihabitans fulvus TaxID=1892852 RepID=A0A5B2XBU0_9PSEU|nr:rhomboid family intramembrane serine protease [Solihabitans fulvus]KAA2260666.1 rhomboid family intramembrane serine protease [Solihabitans fulvus]
MASRALRGAALARATHWVAGAPLTFSFLALFWLVGIVTGSIGTGPSRELLDTVGFGVSSPPWTVLTSALWSMDLIGYLGTTVLLLVFGVLAERELGAVRTAAVFLVCHTIGSFLGAGLVWLGMKVEWRWLTYLDGEVAVGPSVGLVGLALALSYRLPPLWRRRVRLLFVFTLLVLALYSGYLQDVLRVGGGAIGLLVGWIWRARDARPAPPSHAEARVLVALLLAASALGPMVALIAPYSNGPLSWFVDVLTASRPDPQLVADTCADPAAEETCRMLSVRASYGRVPALVMSFLPALLLLVLAEGLRRGRRFAWWSALTLNLALAGLMALLGAVSIPDDTTIANMVDHGVPVLVPLSIAVVLLVTRGHFPLVLPRPSVISFWRRTGAAFAALSALWIVGGSLASEQFTPSPEFTDLVADLPARFLPPGYLNLMPVRFAPDEFIATLLFEWTGVVFWVIVLGGLLMASWRAHPGQPEGAARRARVLMERHGGSSLSYMTTWRGNHYWFTEDGEAAVAYRVVATIALTVGDPIGAPAARDAAVRGFSEFCVHNGWTPCLYSISAELRDAVAGEGWSTVQVAEDTVIPLDTLSFTGKKWQDIRTALNKAAKEGIAAEWIRYPEAPLAITDQVRSISSEWVADKGLPEMGFTLGGIEELSGDGVRCLVAVDADRTVHGVTSWLPVYQDGAIVGWTLDFMRRRSAGFRGTTEFLIASAALTLKEEGAAFLSLSGAPLARLDRGEQPRGVQRLLDVTGQVLEPVYGFRSLFAFKAKFQPVYRPMFMAYPDSAALPRIANAVSRAYLPHLNTRQGLRLARKMITRRPQKTVAAT